MSLHPIVEQLKPSQDQLPAITARDRDVVVTAGAGTGKTRTLVARYLALLSEGHSLRSIIAITFTRKAAREMHNRVREALRQYLARPDITADEHELWSKRYAELDAARIDTIHGLCAEILRAHPAEAGIDPRFVMLDEAQGAGLRNQAVEEALARAADDAPSLSLFTLLGERSLRKTLMTLLENRTEAIQAFRGDSPQWFWSRWERGMSQQLCKFLDHDAVRSAVEDLLAVRENGILARAAAAGDKLAEPLEATLRRWDEVVRARQAGDWAAVAACLAPLRAGLKSNAGQTANWKPADPKAALKDFQAIYDEQMKDWVGKGLDLTLDRQLAEMLPQLKHWFEWTAHRYDELKLARQALDFDDLEQQALSLLEKHPEVRRRWQEEIKALLLVDEFQDTNYRQLRLVKALNRGGRLFIVGDAKQSIYRFRGAEVQVFREERESIAKSGGLRCDLGVSYRSHRGLLQGLNDLLRPILGERDDPNRPWAEPFAALAHIREEAAQGLQAPYIELHLVPGNKADGALRRAADAVVTRLAAWVERGEITIWDPDRRSHRALNYGDIAILCRSSGSFAVYEDALDDAGLPYLTVAGRGFYDRPEIRDLLNALRALADPTDDLALVGLLRSPVMGLSDLALHWLGERRRELGTAGWWSALQACAGDLPGEAGGQALRAVKIVGELHELAGRAPVADLLKAFLDATLYRAALYGSGQGRAVRNVGKLLTDAHASRAVGVGEFLEYVTELRESGSREGEARATADGAVQVMSIHAAKGLEFPIVVIGDVGHVSRSRNDLLLDQKWGPLLPVKAGGESLPAFYRLAQLEVKDKEKAESDRLLYVAATRAKEALLFSGTVGQKGEGVSLTGWLERVGESLELAQALSAHLPAGSGTATFTVEVGASRVGCTVYGPDWEPGRAAHEVAPAQESRLVFPPPLLAPIEADPARTGQEDGKSITPPQRVWRVVPRKAYAEAPAWVVGTIVHAALAAWRFPDKEFARWAEARARDQGLTDARQIADAVRESRLLLERFRDHAVFRAMDGADRRLHEVPYSLKVDDRVESGIVDALYCKGGEWFLMEFKTDRIASAAQLAIWLEEKDYVSQVERYLRAAKELLGVRPHPVLCFLNCAGTVQLVEDRWEGK